MHMRLFVKLCLKNCIIGKLLMLRANLQNALIGRKPTKSNPQSLGNNFDGSNDPYFNEVIEITDSEGEKVDDSAEGHTIYKTNANIGEFKGEVRYISILKDNDKN